MSQSSPATGLFILHPSAFILLQWHRWESNPHTPRFELGRSACWRTVPVIESAQWESNPHVRHGKAAGSRYIMGAVIPVEAVGVEPTSSRLRGGRLADIGHTSSGIADCRFVIEDWKA